MHSISIFFAGICKHNTTRNKSIKKRPIDSFLIVYGVNKCSDVALACGANDIKTNN